MPDNPNQSLAILRELPDEIAGEHILLRRLRPGDGSMLWSAVEESREHLAAWMPWVEETRSENDCEAYARRAAARWILREDLGVVILDRVSGRYLGGTGLIRIDWDIPAFEIGYWLRTSAWGQGYVSEAVRLLCGLAFDTLDAKRVHIHCDALNERSAAVAERLGFALEARLRNSERNPSGKLCDTLVFAMTPEDYASAQITWITPYLAP